MHLDNTDVLSTIFYRDGVFEGQQCKMPVVEYLKFLHLSGDEAGETVLKLRNVLASHPIEIVVCDICCALSQLDWRPHLMAGVAIADGFHDSKSILTLWNRLRAGSWVSPQLVATAAYADCEFTNNAIAVIDDPHSSSKSIVSLAAILQKRFSFDFGGREYLEPVVERAKLSDPDGSGCLALNWFDALGRILG